MGFIKVTPAEGQKITQEFYALLRPAILKHPNENNSALLTAFLQGRDLDITAVNLLKAAKALENSLDWQTPPKPKPTKFVEQSNHGARVNHADLDAVKANADSLGVKSLRKAYVEEREAQAAKASREAFADCDRAIRSFTRNTHSKTYAGRERLQKKFDELRKSTDGVKVLAELQNFAQSIE